MGDNIEHDGERQPPPTDSVLIDARLREVERQEKEDKKQQQEYNRKQLRFNSRLVWFTGLLVVTSAVSDLLMLRQASIAKLSADAANTAAQAASDTLSNIKTSGAETKNQIDRLIAQQQRTADAMEKSLSRAKESMEASNAQSKAALDASVEAFRLDQRAWLTVLWEFPEIPIPDGLMKTTAKIANTGKTPALNVTGNVTLTMLNAGTSPDFENTCGLAQHVERGTIFSNNSQSVLLVVLVRIENSKPCPIPDNNSSYLGGPAGFLVLYGKITYTDVFGKAHWMQFCRSESGQPIGPRHDSPVR